MADDAVAEDFDEEFDEIGGKKKFSGKKLILFVVLPVLLLGGGGIAFMMMGGPPRATTLGDGVSCSLGSSSTRLSQVGHS